MNYRWIIIKSSLKEPKIINNYRILAKTNFGDDQDSKIYKVQVLTRKIPQLVEQLSTELLDPYYTHLYSEDPNEDELIVIFPGKVIYSSKKDPKTAVEYGLSHGVSQDQMDIQPRNIADETW